MNRAGVDPSSSRANLLGRLNAHPGPARTSENGWLQTLRGLAAILEAQEPPVMLTLTTGLPITLRDWMVHPHDADLVVLLGRPEGSHEIDLILVPWSAIAALTIPAVSNLQAARDLIQDRTGVPPSEGLWPGDGGVPQENLVDAVHPGR